ncbi:MAG TPA: hypothetical protein DCY13_19670 [Verrucomicrobiales bacterium]|nr:hypothetical protein [Verrucomicrobiales bacterium]
MNFLFDHDVPDDLSHVLLGAGHEVTFLRQVLERTAPDIEVLKFAAEKQMVLVTCNRDDFLQLAERQPHAGLVIVVRRKSRVAEKSALLKLVESAGESGIVGNINYA